jgi:DMSO/TMAO reductase YedYZ molybdopterin-dependent catalytic subunit
MISRRDFLKRAVLGGTAASFAARFPVASPLHAQNSGIPGKELMIVRSPRFFDLEMPLDKLQSWITPVDLFFVRNHVSEPYSVNPDTWRLNVTGEVDHPLELSYADLQKLDSVTVTNTLECAGNGRAFFEPHAPGIQWQRGAVGNARWTGPRLNDLLNRAGVKPTGKHVVFKGLEEPPGKVPQFMRSIPIEKALDPDTLVATHMNGEKLSPHHGFPARIMVPGWIGAASLKWVAEIRVLDHEFDGNYMKPGYRLPERSLAPGEDLKPGDVTNAVTKLNVKSVIAAPGDGSLIRRRPFTIRGAAWAGEADVTRVDVSVDNGQTWKPADLGQDHAKYAWRLWQYTWTPQKAGGYVIMSRATDSAGRVQPAQAAWNPSGYLWNAIDQVKIHVQA